MGKDIKIVINNKISKLKKEEILDIFVTLEAIRISEKGRGNGYDKAWLKIKYRKNFVVTEHINISDLVRVPTLYSVISYFKNIEKRFDKQNTETKINMNDYLEGEDLISQEILIMMVFNVESKVEDIEIIKTRIKKSINIDDYTLEELYTNIR